MNKYDLKEKANGHLKAANMLEKRARRAGKSSDLFIRYLHHCEQYSNYMKLSREA